MRPKPPPAAPRSLEEELQDAVEAVAVGQNMRPGLPGVVATAARGVLLRRGFGKSQVNVRQEGAGLAVSIQLIDGRATLVRSIHLSVEGL
ncbi:hypothetical protein L6R49_01550 [Myxococcota bacterium]|nr:hypothetical protein [Myxococcota bacterium]